MKKIIFLIVFVSILSHSNSLFSQTKSDKNIILKTLNYNLKIKPDFKEEKLYATCELTVMNPVNKEIRTIPLLLYRLLKVTSIEDEYGNPIPFNQRVLSYEDWEVMQVNFVEINLKKALTKNKPQKIIIKYNGYLLGYSETGMNYVKDKIDPKFTIIRPDCKAYPVIGYPSTKMFRKAITQSFDYSVETTVPDSLTVVNGGKLIAKTEKNGYATYRYKNIKKAWRMDITIGKYGVFEYDKVKLFFLQKDSIGAKTVLKYIKNTFELYTNWWGPLQDFKGFSVIEIPDGYGSQADVTSILQTASVFKDSTQMRQLYHEISHIWNVKPTDEFYPRWNEGLATFLEYLVIEKLENREYLDYVTDWYMNRLKNDLKEDSVFAHTPMIDFGKKNITGYSYSMGMIMFQVLYKTIGEQQFNKIIGSFYQKYYKSGATTQDFIKQANIVTNLDLTDFFNDWLYSTKYKEYVLKDMSIDEIAEKYKKNKE